MTRKKLVSFAILLAILLSAALVLGACAGAQGPQGSQGATGERGVPGERGAQGAPGTGPSQAEIKALIAEAVRGAPITVSSIARGGRLYDNWVAESKATTPAANQPLWALQTTNTRSGIDTWRCKECHGWDYKGKGGAYSKGSHLTGFVGVYDAGTSKSQEQLLEIMRGATDSRHDFSKVLDAQSLAELAGFLSSSLVNETPYIDYSTKKPIGANVTHGAQLYGGVCAACHGADGKQLNFGSAAAPEYVGTLALDNPWEFVHKVRYGQPAATMPSGLVNGWNLQDVTDLLAHAQTLPAK